MLKFWLILSLLHLYTGQLHGPSQVDIISYNETEVVISWAAASYPKFEGYHIRVTPIKSFPTSVDRMTMDHVVQNTSTQAHLRDLHPGTQYNITVAAALPNNTESSPAYSVFWTEIGKPDIPASIKVMARDGTILKIQLHPTISDKGPISGIQIIVHETSTILAFNEDQLFNQSIAEERGLPFYVTALLTDPIINDSTFIVGNKQMYGGYFNAPLNPDFEYEIRIGVISTLNGVSKTAFSPLEQNNNFDVPYSNDDDVESAWMSFGVSRIIGISVGVSCFLLLALLFLYFILRHHYGKRRPSDEMVLHDQINDMEEMNGFTAGVLHIADDTNLEDFWELLKERYWTIPRELLEISEQVLGNGHFGEVRKGTVHKRGKPISVLVQFSQSQSAMGDSERRSLYSEIDGQIRLGTHPNVAEFVGICEDRGVLHLVAECFDSSLRGFLLRSRQQAGPRYCNLTEQFLLELALRIAEGLKYISDHGVLHKRLSSRSVAIVDSYQPKVTNFGLFFYHPAGKKLDYGRWLAPEAARSRTYTVKSDVWSFGVLLWEICTLGGTPFVDIPTIEVYPRTIQGLRLPHPTGVSDELFQLMLQCWELDADERPSFHELVAVLQNIVLSASDHIRFDRVSGFQFPKFDPKGDEH